MRETGPPSSASQSHTAAIPCERCGQYVCTCTSGPSFWTQLRELTTVDPMVPKGYIEVRDADGKLLSRHKFGGTE